MVKNGKLNESTTYINSFITTNSEKIQLPFGESPFAEKYFSEVKHQRILSQKYPDQQEHLAEQSQSLELFQCVLKKNEFQERVDAEKLLIQTKSGLNYNPVTLLFEEPSPVYVKHSKCLLGLIILLGSRFANDNDS